jgi:hypothetical protein
VSLIRLLVKEGQFGSARASADSLYRDGLDQYAGVVAGLAGVAAITGHIERAAALLGKEADGQSVRTLDGRVIRLPPQISRTWTHLVIFSALNVHADSIAVITDQIEELARSYFPSKRTAAEVADALLVPTLTFAFPSGQRALLHLSDLPDETSQAFVALARGDTADSRRRLQSVKRSTAGRVSGTSIDGNFRRATLSLALGDTAGALGELDPILRALPTLGPNLLSQVTHAASLVRALTLRAELAARAHDRPTSVRCARAVIDIWQNADPPLQSLVLGMRKLAQ